MVWNSSGQIFVDATIIVDGDKTILCHVKGVFSEKKT